MSVIEEGGALDARRRREVSYCLCNGFPHEILKDKQQAGAEKCNL